MIRSSRKSAPRWPAISGGVLFLAGILLLSLILPRGLEEKRAYESAPRCTGAQPSSECRWRGLVTVTGKERRKDGKHKPYYLRFSRGGESSQWVEMKGGVDTVSKAVEPGDTVTATYWRGLIREVTFAGRRTATEHDPADDYGASVFGAILLFIAGLTSIAVAWRRSLRLRRAPS